MQTSNRITELNAIKELKQLQNGTYERTVYKND